MHNIEIPHKNKSLSLFRINACSLNKNFDDLQNLLSCTKTKQNNNLNLNNYSFDFAPTETSVGGTLLYIANHLSYECQNDLNIYKKINLKLLLLKFSIQKKSNIIVGIIYS